MNMEATFAVMNTTKAVVKIILILENNSAVLDRNVSFQREIE